jgi:pyruvate-formate lyase
VNGITERVHRLQERYLATPPAIDAERAVIITRSYQETEGEPMILRRAKALKKLLNEMTICGYVNCALFDTSRDAVFYNNCRITRRSNTVFIFRCVDNNSVRLRVVQSPGIPPIWPLPGTVRTTFDMWF